MEVGSTTKSVTLLKRSGARLASERPTSEDAVRLIFWRRERRGFSKPTTRSARFCF